MSIVNRLILNSKYNLFRVDMIYSQYIVILTASPPQQHSCEPPVVDPFIEGSHFRDQLADWTCLLRSSTIFHNGAYNPPTKQLQISEIILPSFACVETPWVLALELAIEVSTHVSQYFGKTNGMVYGNSLDFWNHISDTLWQWNMAFSKISRKL